MPEVKVIERPDAEHRNILGQVKKEKNRSRSLTAFDMFKVDGSCSFSLNGETLVCQKGDCRSCNLPLTLTIKEGHSHPDSEVEDQSLRVLELERQVKQLELEKAALHNMLAKVEVKA